MIDLEKLTPQAVLKLSGVEIKCTFEPSEVLAMSLPSGPPIKVYCLQRTEVTFTWGTAGGPANHE